MLKKILIGSALLLVAGAAAVWLAGTLVLTPPRAAWKEIPPWSGVEEVRFKAPDGVELKGWWWPGQDPKRAVVLLHGLRANRLQMLSRATWLHDLGYSVFLFDFRGCGESAGEGTLGFDERLDVQAALRFFREETGVTGTLIVGNGMGAAAAMMAVDQWDGVKGAVLELPFDRLEGAVRVRMRLRFGALERVLSPLLLRQVRPRLGFSPDALAPVEKLGRARCPILLGIGGKDETLPQQAVGDLFAVAPHPTTLWIVSKADHVDLFQFDPASYKAKIGWFIRQTLGPSGREIEE